MWEDGRKKERWRWQKYRIQRNKLINYFAFVCLTTVGFGDINPALPLARMLSVVTSIAGPLYLAVVMGVLIGRFAGSVQSSGSSD